jgi:hypothetical protein
VLKIDGYYLHGLRISFKRLHLEPGKQKHLHVYQTDQLNFRQGVGVWNLHPLEGLHIGGIYEMKII